jgi:hypothetical protein
MAFYKQHQHEDAPAIIPVKKPFQFNAFTEASIPGSIEYACRNVTDIAPLNIS